MIDAFLAAASQPWAIEESALRNLLAIADRCGDLEALQQRAGARLSGARTTSIRNGVAIVPITGPILRYANLFTEISGATSTQVLATDLTTAIDDPAVKAIVLEINSPGGQADGIAEMAKAIFAARQKKPITAYIGGIGASAAYWLASAADDIVIDRTALLGSIGVVMAAKDTRIRDEKAGVRQIEIVSSQSPKKRVDVFTPEGQTEVQAIVDQLANVFIADVAMHRGVTPGTVKERFGQGGMLVGQAAVSAGMADRLGNLEALLAERGASSGSTYNRFNAAGGSTASSWDAYFDRKANPSQDPYGWGAVYERRKQPRSM